MQVACRGAMLYHARVLHGLHLVLRCCIEAGQQEVTLTDPPLAPQGSAAPATSAEMYKRDTEDQSGT